MKKSNLKKCQIEKTSSQRSNKMKKEHFLEITSFEAYKSFIFKGMCLQQNFFGDTN
jgi:hypothetical protein